MYLVEQLEKVDGCSAIFLAVVMFYAGQFLARQDAALHDRGIKIGAATFIIWIAVACGLGALASASDLFSTVLRGLFLAAVASVATWFTLTTWSALKAGLLDPLLEKSSIWQTNACRAADAEDERRRSEDEQRKAEERWARDEPAREQERRQAAERKQLEEERLRNDQRRRDDARANSKLLFTTFAPDVGKRFTRRMFEDYLHTYMGDDRAPEEVEERARQLEATLQDHRAAVCPPPRFRNVEELAHWYVAEKARIESLPIDELFKEQQLVQLASRYSELTQTILERQ